MVSFDEIARQSKKAVVLGIGGGGDVVGTIPTANYLNSLGVETVLGGLTYERFAIDPVVGPRKLEEIENIELLSETVGLASKNTKTRDGVVFAETKVARVLKTKTILLDITLGAQGIVKGLNTAMKKLGTNLFIGIDVGGDSLSSGKEPGIRSPIADSLMIAAMNQLNYPAVLGMVGYGSDGELTIPELNRNIAKIIAADGFLGARSITPADIVVLDQVLEKIETEASKLFVNAAKGKRGRFTIRGGQRTVELRPIAAITFYFDPRIVLDTLSITAKKVYDTTSIEEADEILRKMNLITEIQLEEGYMKKSVR